MVSPTINFLKGGKPQTECWIWIGHQAFESTRCKVRHQKEGRQNYRMIKFIRTLGIKSEVFKARSPNVRFASAWKCKKAFSQHEPMRFESFARTKQFWCLCFEPSVSSLASLLSAGLLHFVVQNKAPETFPTCLWHRSGGPARFWVLSLTSKWKGGEARGRRSAFPRRRRKTRLLPLS